MGFRNQRATSGGDDFESAPEGTHSAVCTRLVDMGTQSTKFGDKRKIQLGFEIEERRDDGKRFMAFGYYTLSLHPKSNLRHILESWRGRAYQDEEDVDLVAVVGKPCLITLVRAGDYTNISSVTPLVRGMTPIAPEGDTVVFDCDEPDLGELDKLSDRMREKIQASPEYRAATGTGAQSKSELEHDRPLPIPSNPPYIVGKAGPELRPTGEGYDDLDDTIPF